VLSALGKENETTLISKSTAVPRVADRDAINGCERNPAGLAKGNVEPTRRARHHRCGIHIHLAIQSISDHNIWQGPHVTTPMWIMDCGLELIQRHGAYEASE
jgi:hypothetical protein